MNQAARVDRIKSYSDEVVAGRVTQINDGVGDDGADIDEAGRTRLG
jgi:hypothetical protein